MKRLPLLTILMLVLSAQGCDSVTGSGEQTCKAVNVTNQVTSVYIRYDPHECDGRPKSLTVSFYGDEKDYRIENLGYAKFHEVWFHGPELWHQKYERPDGLRITAEDVEEMITDIEAVVLHS